MLHVRPGRPFAMLAMLHLSPIHPTGTARRLHGILRRVRRRVRTEVGKQSIGSVDGVRDLGRHRLVDGNRAGMALDWMMLLLALLTFHLLLTLHLFSLALSLFAFSVRHLFLLSLSLDHLALPGVSLTLSIKRLRRRMLHRLSYSWKGVSGAVGRALRMLSVWRWLVRTTGTLG